MQNIDSLLLDIWKEDRIANLICRQKHTLDISAFTGSQDDTVWESKPTRQIFKTLLWSSLTRSKPRTPCMPQAPLVVTRGQAAGTRCLSGGAEQCSHPLQTQPQAGDPRQSTAAWSRSQLEVPAVLPSGGGGHGQRPLDSCSPAVSGTPRRSCVVPAASLWPPHLLQQP